MVKETITIDVLAVDDKLTFSSSRLKNVVVNEGDDNVLKKLNEIMNE